MNHTPGPWKWVKCPKSKEFAVISVDHEETHKIFFTEDIRIADIELIAAAPELLELVRELSEFKSANRAEWCELREKARELIKKIEG